MGERQLVASKTNAPMVNPNPVIMADASGKMTKSSAKARKFGRRRQHLEDEGQLAPFPTLDVESRSQSLSRDAQRSAPPPPQPTPQLEMGLGKDARIQEGQAAIRGRPPESRQRPREASLPILPDRHPPGQPQPLESWDDLMDWQQLGMPGGGEKVLLPHQIAFPQTHPRSAPTLQPPELFEEEPPTASETPGSGQRAIAQFETTLPEQVDYINQLSADLEAALFRLRAMSLQGNDRTTDEPTGKANIGPALQDCEAAVLPYVHQQSGGYVLANRQVDLLKAEREAASTAQLLRRLIDRPSPSPKPPPSPARAKKTPPERPNERPNERSKRVTPAKPIHSKSASKTVSPAKGGELIKFDPTKRSPRNWLYHWLKPPTNWLNALADGLAWMVAAGIVRIGLQILLTAYPTLWMPVTLLVVIPVMLAAYQAAFVSKSGWLLAYRLLLVMLGLLLGGRFWSF